MTFGDHITQLSQARFQNLPPGEDRDMLGWELRLLRERLDHPRYRTLVDTELASPVGQEMNKALQAFIACVDSFASSEIMIVSSALIRSLEVIAS